MAQPIPLYYVNGGDPPVIQCSNPQCRAILDPDGEVCKKRTPTGTKYFCKAEPDEDSDTCYLIWTRRTN